MPRARKLSQNIQGGLRIFLGPLFLLAPLWVHSNELSIKELAQSKSWLKLLRYKDSHFSSGVESQVDGDEFFLCKTGKTDPECELQADRSAFLSGTKDSICHFPARLKWMVDVGIISSKSLIDLKGCQDYNNFQQKLSAKSVSLIFSSHYLNNPSSAFGHTFLRFNKEALDAKGERLEFLDQAIDYAADVDTPNALAYAYRGIFGYFKGRFNLLPYFLKVKQYASFESRDLWSYDLNLSSKERQRLIDHLWELGQTYLFYYYFDENCSYHMLSLLEAAKPELELTDKLPFYVIPTDTLRVLNQTQGLVTQIHFRPSLRKRFYARWNQLESQERDAAQNVIDGDFESLQLLTPIKNAEALDLASEYLDFKYPYDIQDPQDPRSKLRRRILSERAKMQLVTPPLVVNPERDRPDQGHPSRRFLIASEYDAHSGTEFNLGIRAALHDTLDSTKGFPKMSQIEFANLELAFAPRHQTWKLNEGSVFRVQSIAAIRELDYPLAWRIDLGARTLKDQSCDRCVSGFLEVGGGYAISLLEEILTASAMVQAEAIGSTRLQGAAASPGIGTRLAVHMHLTDDLQTEFIGMYRYRFFLDHTHSWQGQAEARYAIKSGIAIGAWDKEYRYFRESGGGLFVYF